jgi:hypothetical protein
VVRLTVRVEGFINFLIENYNWKKRKVNGQTINGVEASSFIRGLTDAVSEEKIKDLMAASTALRTTINRHVFPMMERWTEDSIKANHHSQICMLQAHMAFIFHNVPEEKMNRHVVSTHLCAQIVLTARYQFTSLLSRAWHERRRAAQEKELKAARLNKNKDGSGVLTIFSLDIPETTLFDIWARQRNKVLNFLDRYPHEANQVMEAVVRVITLTGTRTKKYATSSNADQAASLVGAGGSLSASAHEQLTIRKWRSMRGRNNKGRFIPDMEEELTEEEKEARAAYDQAIAEEEAARGHGRLAQPTDEAASDTDAAANAAREASKSEQVVPSSTQAHSASAMPTKAPGVLSTISGAVSSLLKSKKTPTARSKATINGPITVDGFVLSSPSEAVIEESDQVLDTEINIQLGDFTLKSSRLEVLNEYLPLAEYEDYTSIFGRHVDATPMQCAEVRHSSRRQWFRLVGRRHDVLFWDADRREVPLYPHYTRSYSTSDTEPWIVKALENIRQKFLAGMELFLPADRYPTVAPYGMLQGVATRIVEEKPIPTGNKEVDKVAPNVQREHKTLHEIVVFQKQRVVHIYTVQEHGRRFYRTLKFVSDARFSLADLKVKIPRVITTKKWGQ